MEILKYGVLHKIYIRIPQIVCVSDPVHVWARTYTCTVREELRKKDEEISEGKKELQDALSDVKIANEHLDEYMVGSLPHFTHCQSAINPLPMPLVTLPALQIPLSHGVLVAGEREESL